MCKIYNSFSNSSEIFKVVQEPVVQLGAGEVQVCAVPCSALQKSCKALHHPVAGVCSALQPRLKPAVWRRARHPDYWHLESWTGPAQAFIKHTQRAVLQTLKGGDAKTRPPKTFICSKSKVSNRINNIFLTTSAYLKINI